MTIKALQSDCPWCCSSPGTSKAFLTFGKRSCWNGEIPKLISFKAQRPKCHCPKLSSTRPPTVFRKEKVLKNDWRLADIVWIYRTICYLSKIRHLWITVVKCVPDASKLKSTFNGGTLSWVPRDWGQTVKFKHEKCKKLRLYDWCPGVRRFH